MTGSEPTAKAERPLEGLEALYGPTIAKAERLMAARAEFDRTLEAAKAEYERAVRAIEQEPDP